jgi:hypothetical protein
MWEQGILVDFKNRQALKRFVRNRFFLTLLVWVALVLYVLFKQRSDINGWIAELIPLPQSL